MMAWCASTWLRGPSALPRTAAFTLDAAHVDSAGYRAHSASRRDARPALLAAICRPRPDTVTLLANSFDLQADDPQGLTVAELDGDRRAATHWRLAVRYPKKRAPTPARTAASSTFPAPPTPQLTTYTGNRRPWRRCLSGAGRRAGKSAQPAVAAIDLDRDYRGVDARWRWSWRQGLRQPLALTFGIQHDVSDETRAATRTSSATHAGRAGRPAPRRDQPRHHTRPLRAC